MRGPAAGGAADGDRADFMKSPEPMTDKTVVRNTISLFAGSAALNMLSFLLMVIIARRLGDVGVGQYSFIFAVGSFIVLVCQPGLEYLIVKEVPARKELMAHYGANIFTLKVLFSFLAVAVAIALSPLLPKDAEVIRSFLVVCVLYGIEVPGSVFLKTLHAHERMGLSSLAEVIERGIATLPTIMK